MDDKTYNSIFLSCSCGATFRSMSGEARHRHNFPALCRPSRKRTPPVGGTGGVKSGPGRNGRTSNQPTALPEAATEIPMTKLPAG
jgi:hypothetical protein